MDSPLFYFFLALHITSLIVGMGSVIIIDTFGLLWLLKKTDLAKVIRIAQTTQKLIWIGWGGLVLSGLGLITLKGYIDNLTIIKLFFVVLVGANGVFLHYIKKSMKKIQNNSLSPRIIFNISLASTISQVGWWSAILIGLLHRHWRHKIDWPQSPELYIIGITALIILVAFLGKTFLSDSTNS